MADKDSTGDAQGRFTVAIPKSLRPGLDRKAKEIAGAVREKTGVEIQLTPAQVVQSIIETACKPEASGEPKAS